MHLSLDVGNSAVKGALFDGRALREVFSVTSSDEVSASTVARWQKALAPHLEDRTVERAGLVSVVPETAELVADAVRTLTGAPVSFVDPHMDLPFTLAYETPDTLGNDRLAAAAAGWVEFGRDAARSVLVVDVGTAVNYEVVHRDGVYEGGAIGAGPALVREALCSGTSELPRVPLTLPATPLGRSTRTALQSGIMWGLVDAIRGMIDRLSVPLPDTPVLLLTGGWSASLARHLDRVDHHAPHLVLQGVHFLTSRSDASE